MAEGNVLELTGITKRFPGVLALDTVDMVFRKGEVHALVGENGAGKSTLMKILSGVYQADSGTILFSGGSVVFRNPSQAQDAGIAIIFQEFSLIRTFTVAENVFLNREPSGLAGFKDMRTARKETGNLLREIGFDLDPDARIEDLTVVQQQVVEIVKALSITATVLIMDEPSAALTDKELKNLFGIIRVLKARGVTIIYISHMLQEIFEIADRATVMKDGETIGTKNICETTKEELIRMMVGREIKDFFPASVRTRKEELLSVSGLRKGRKLDGVDFSLHAGEILGIAGMAGSGQTDLAKALFGVEAADSGEIKVLGKTLNIKSVRQAIGAGIGYISEDRKNYGILGPMAVRVNITVADLGRFLRGGVLSGKKEREEANKKIGELGIKVAGMNQRADTLSGGNQQKMLIARWLLKKPRIFIIVEPTRGIDVGAKTEIYRIMRALVESGSGILMVSSDLPEVIGISDRILVMRSGRIEGIIDQSGGLTTEERIMSLAVGHDYSFSEGIPS
ncbi:MAG: hypothetical protein A3J97_04350 [Spirochaetes bacterium RIFOXYC1_FULL_54_7]|nr:MAG: hypothetical protein A3J97_04350 [Spirochaetes bacterium RIFOXYC1_FULL_54_7]